MKELERRALMGDRMAQKKYTILGEALPCPCCGEKAGVCLDIDAPPETPYCCSCFNCELMVYGKTEREALGVWNTRTAPPVGRCKDCKYFGEIITKDPKNNEFFCNHDQYGLFALDSTDAYCSYFEPEDPEKDEKWKAKIDAML